MWEIGSLWGTIKKIFVLAIAFVTVFVMLFALWEIGSLFLVSASWKSSLICSYTKKGSVLCKLGLCVDEYLCSIINPVGYVFEKLTTFMSSRNDQILLLNVGSVDMSVYLQQLLSTDISKHAGTVAERAMRSTRKVSDEALALSVSTEAAWLESHALFTGNVPATLKSLERVLSFTLKYFSTLEICEKEDDCIVEDRAMILQESLDDVITMLLDTVEGLSKLDSQLEQVISDVSSLQKDVKIATTDLESLGYVINSSLRAIEFAPVFNARALSTTLGGCGLSSGALALFLGSVGWVAGPLFMIGTFISVDSFCMATVYLHEDRNHELKLETYRRASVDIPVFIERLIVLRSDLAKSKTQLLSFRQQAADLQIWLKQQEISLSKSFINRLLVAESLRVCRDTQDKLRDMNRKQELIHAALT